MGWLWWIGAALVLGILEMLSLDLVLAMFAGGAIAGAIAYLLGAPVPVQFIVAARRPRSLLLFTLRPWLLRHLRARMPLVETNAAALVGREAVVVSTGRRRGRPRQARRRGLERARDAAETIPPGTEVRVTGSTAPRRSSQPVAGALSSQLV